MSAQQPAAPPLGPRRFLVPRKNLLDDWIKQRVRRKRAPTALPFEVRYQNVYVLPTQFGLAFGLMLVFMALGGLNFNNNMALLLVFLLATIAQMTTFIAYRNLAGLRIENVHAAPVFCGQAARFRVFLANPTEQRRFVVQAGFDKPQVCTDIIPAASSVIELNLASSRRGWLEMLPFRLETRFPLGLFKAWTWVFPSSRCLVYPAPARNAPPLPRIGQGQSGLARKGDGDQVHGLRKYQLGDSLQRIAWRASARHDELYSLEMESPSDEACVLDWHALQGLDAEKRLSVLTAWVLAAEQEQLAYSLVLPDRGLPAGAGPDHRSACLEMLALYDP